MVWIDYAILIVIGLSTLISLVRGFVKEAMSLVVWFAAFFIASQFYLKLATHLTQMQDEMVRNGVAVAIIEISDPSQIPFFAEPFFLNFNADCEFRVAMSMEDLGRAKLDELGEKWG